MDNPKTTYIDIINKLEELRLVMKRVHKRRDVPYKKPGFQAMMLISEKGKVTMQELGEELSVTKPRVTALVTELVENDFIEQTGDKVDKRKKYLTLAPKGTKYIEKHCKEYEEWVEKLWIKLDDKEKEAFDITLMKMNQILKEEVENKEENNETN